MRACTASRADALRGNPYHPPFARWMTHPNPDALVECRNLVFGYGARRILDNVSFTVPRGKVTALMGASGGGKTTVLRLIGGQVRARRGEVRVNGEDVGAMGSQALYAARRG